MHIDFLGIQAFLAIVERGSFQLAAAQLHLSQTAVSHRLRKLEDSLGVRLLARTTREVLLTEEGRALLQRTHGAVHELGTACESLRSQGRSLPHAVKLACLPTLAASVMPPVLKAFRKSHPALSVCLHDDSIEHIADLVAARHVGFGIGVALPVRAELASDTIAHEPFVLVCPAGHRLATQARVRWQDLRQEELIRISLPFDGQVTIDDAIGATGRQLQWRYECQRHAVALRLVRAGLGLAVVPRMNVGDTSGLALVALHEPPIARTLCVVTRRDHVPTPAEADLRARCEAHIRTVLRKWPVLVDAAHS